MAPYGATSQRRAPSSTSGLVAAMVATELKNLLLPAGHDLAATEIPVTLDVAAGGGRYALLHGREDTLKAENMMVDHQGVISSVLSGPDQRTPITPETPDVFCALSVPAGIPSASRAPRPRRRAPHGSGRRARGYCGDGGGPYDQLRRPAAATADRRSKKSRRRARPDPVHQKGPLSTGPCASGPTAAAGQ
jgi:hypothetical protein